MKYCGFCDPSGGSSDSMTLAIARTSQLGTKAILVGAWEKCAPFNPDIVVEEFAGILRDYHLTTVTGDHYSAEWVVARFRAHGTTYNASERTKSEIFLEFLALVNSDRVRIPNNRRLRAQFVSLERRVSRTGKDSVDHPPAAHDDMANAVAGALVLAASTGVTREPIACVIDLNDRPADAFAPRTEEDLRTREREAHFFRKGGSASFL